MLFANTKSALGLLLGLGLLSSMTALAMDETPGAYGHDMQALVYVNHVTVPEQVAAGHGLTIKVEGSLPDPAWKFLKLEVQRQGKTITVHALGTRSPSKIAIQVLKPFTASTTIDKLTPGKYEVIVMGRKKEYRHTVQVTGKSDKQAKDK